MPDLQPAPGQRQYGSSLPTMPQTVCHMRRMSPGTSTLDH